MWHDVLLRFCLGGIVVSLFSLLGDLFKPKSFAGIFGAAPSIALGTLGLTIANEGSSYAASEARSMMAGAIAFLVYSHVVSWAIMRYRASSFLVASLSLTLWLGLAIGIWYFALRALR